MVIERGKMTLVEHGFRLPSALDNRPLKYDEFFKAQKQVIFTSATPSTRELEFSEGIIVEQIIRPTGLLDPQIKLEKTEGQIDNLINQIRKRTNLSQRVLVTTLTKRMAEDLTDFLKNLNIRVRYLHSEIDTIERVKIINDLRMGLFDVLVGINLLREGLDIPEVSLVAVLDADKEGFLRSKSSLLQVAGRAARNIDGKVILYGDNVTDSMSNLIDITKKRRKIQKEYNTLNKIEPKSIEKAVLNNKLIDNESNKEMKIVNELPKGLSENGLLSINKKEKALSTLRKMMLDASKNLQFENAAKLRDQIKEIESDLERIST